MLKLGKLVLLIGPSGVGKSVILKSLRASHSELIFPKSATTRRRRPGEGGELYHFVSDAEFDRWIREEKFLEWAQVHESARYGTLRSEIIPAIEQGRIVVREVDVQGFQSIRSSPEFSGQAPPYRLQTIFILPEDIDQLKRRITKRAPISPGELEARLKSMERELSVAEQTDVQIVNREGRIAETIRTVESVVLKK